MKLIIEVKQTISLYKEIEVGDKISESSAQELLDLAATDDEFDVNSEGYKMIERYISLEDAFDAEGYTDVTITSSQE